MIRLAAVIGAAAFLRQFCVLPYLANQVLWRVDGRTHRAVIDPDIQDAAILARTSIGELRTISNSRKDEVTYHLLFAANLRLLGQTSEALEHYNAALRFDQRPEIYAERGETLLELGRTVNSIPDFVKAARFDDSIVDLLDPRVRAAVAGQLRP
jgi:tetratricopeptide (TPR) repeat protein